MIKRFTLALLSLFAAARLPAAEMMTPAVPLTPDCRYLIIVDTSLSMARMADSTASSLYQLVSSGLYGQMKEGEVFTIWTFNEAIQQREFPLNAWIPGMNQSIGHRVVQFMERQKYRRTPNMGALMNALTRARRICPKLAVLLITDGSRVIVGTPFDRTINNAYGWRAEELRAAKVPFVTVLMSDQGNFVASAVHAANEPFRLPTGPDGRPVVGQSNEPAPPPINPVIVSTIPKPSPTAGFKPVVTPAQPREMREIEKPPVIPPAPRDVIGRPNAAPMRPRTVRPTIEISPKANTNSNVVNATDIKPRVKTPVPTSFSKQPKDSENANTNVVIVRGTNSLPRSKYITNGTNAAVRVKLSRSKPLAIVTTANAVAAPVRTNRSLPTQPPPGVIRTAVIAPIGTNAAQQVPQIQIITQLVNVPVPRVVVEIPEQRAEQNRVVTNSAVIAGASSSTVSGAAAPDAAPQVKLVSVGGAAPGRVSTDSKPEPAKVPNSTPALLVGGPGESKQPTPGVGARPGASAWIYLIVAVGVLTIALLCSKKLLQRPGDPSLISQSMEER